MGAPLAGVIGDGALSWYDVSAIQMFTRWRGLARFGVA